MMKKIAILGSTGSIGVNALKIIEAHPDKFQVVALAAGSNVAKLAKQVEKFKPGIIALADEKHKDKLKKSLAGFKGKMYFGPAGMIEVAVNGSADIVLMALSGAAAIMPLYEAIIAGKQIALANKEAIVACGDILLKAARKNKALVLPVDSEHSAIFQCLEGRDPKTVKRIYLTSSGGPFLGKGKRALNKVSAKEAVNHPRWKMGQKISVDSATLMNKGLEVIEAHHLFNLSYDQIEVLIHPEAIIHSMVEFKDSSIIAQLSQPDMRLPIQYAFSYPERLSSSCPELDFAELGALHFKKPDYSSFSALELAFSAGRAGGTAPVVLNAANEVAVAAFLNNKIKLLEIIKITETVLSRHKRVGRPDLDEVLKSDAWAREEAIRVIRPLRGGFALNRDSKGIYI